VSVHGGDELIFTKEEEMSNKYVIDVGAYAGKHDITIEKANEEIQTKLFSMGYTWGNKSVNVSYTCLVSVYL